MEMRDKGLDLSDEDGPLLHHDPSPSLLPPPMQELGEGGEEA